MSGKSATSSPVLDADSSVLKSGLGSGHGSLLTKGWLRLKEGYLIKTKLVRGMHKSHKLRYFVLFQHPDSKQPQLEYFEGKTLKGSASLANARAIPLPNLRSAQMSVRACIRCFCLHTIRMVTYSHDIHAT